MIINSTFKWLLLLTAITAANASCQTTNNIHPQAGKHLQSTISNNQVGDGAVPSQQVLKPWMPEEVALCLSKINMPAEEPQLAHASNYGTRENSDYLGNRLVSSPRFLVIHETVIGEKNTVNLFKTNHPDDSDQVSYHMLVARDGRLIRVVPDENRAYGAGMSHFMGYTLRTKQGGSGSINNVALHISLVSPSGFDNADSHTGYTDAQYLSLAKQILKWQMEHGIPMSRVTTHYAVDRSHSRYDPRSFYWDKFDLRHSELTRICAVPILAQPAS
jgi:N-acetyl-anhydromuramyl-L-alanine amidase AmpD